MSVGASAAPTVPHPRRPLAEHSVSLRHGTQRGASLEKSFADKNSPGGSNGSSGNSNVRNGSGETSNASTWFDNVNKQVVPKRLDNEPPFFLDSPYHHENGAHFANLPFRTSLQQSNSHGSGSEEFRSIIDDLTIENRSLKKKLAKYQRLEDLHMKEDKLFEVKIHGLSSKKKRELEETLRKFALSLNSPTSSEEKTTSGSGAVAGSGSQTMRTVGKQSSSTSSTRFADSGYGSMSQSQSLSQSNQYNPLKDKSPTETRGQPRTLNHNIHSYLHDIPEGLLPRRSTAMTEKQKKKLVVRRLEQIFGGRGAAPGVHSQSVQQQEVSQSAARDDRTALEALGRRAGKEGTREARMMTTETEDPMSFKNNGNTRETTKDDGDKTQTTTSNDGINEQDFAAEKQSTEEYSDQRPTRPLDLDPDRAQVPSDNVEYFQHLGYLGGAPGNSNGSPNGSSEWVHLNLLMGIAQLHTLNVTLEFVREAILEYSEHFELTSDRRKVRWRHSDRRAGGNSSHAMQREASPEEEDAGPPRKRSLPEYAHNTADSHVSKRQNLTWHHLSDNFHYKPIQAHARDQDDDDTSMADSTEPSYNVATGTTSTHASTQRRWHPRRKRGDGGPIVFYNNAIFCTDFSGDNARPGTLMKTSDYISMAPYPLGVKEAQPRSKMLEYDITRRSEGALSNPLRAQAPAFSGPIADLKWPDQTTPKHVTFADPERPLELEASGLNDIRPDDHFSLTVTRQRRLSPADSPPKERKGLRDIPAKAATVLQNVPAKKVSTQVTDNYGSCRTTKLEPSSLPPASTFFTPDGMRTDNDSDASDSDDSDASDSDDSDSDSDVFMFDQTAMLSSISSSPDSNSISSTSPERPSDSSGTSTSEEESDSDASDQSVDFLATARQVAPDAIRAQERALDAEMAEKWAEELPAGSSAATAGGGSGFNSPVEADAYTSNARVADSSRDKNKRNGRRGVASARKGDDSSDEEVEQAERSSISS